MHATYVRDAHAAGIGPQASAHAQTYIIQLARHTRYFCCVELYSAADFHCELFVFVGYICSPVRIPCVEPTRPEHTAIF